jgi:hypothetical protein
VAEAKENKAFSWQTFESRFIESQGFSGRVANRATGDPPERKTAAPREIGSGGEADLEIGEISEVELYLRFPILARHYGLEAGGR